MKLTPKQEEALDLLSSPAQHIMLYGGSRSGKTFLIVWAIVARSLKAANSRHAVLRFRLNAVKASIINDTLPKVMRIAYPGIEYKIDKQDFICKLPNGSEIWFGGLDDKDRTEKILGMEFATIFLNECSQIPYASYQLAITRLAQRCECQYGETEILPLRMFYDCNPPSMGHWTYKVFNKFIDPDSGKPLADRSLYAMMQINPTDNRENLPDTYIKTLEGLSQRLQRRFLLGEFSDDNPNALFSEPTIDKWRHLDGLMPDMIRIVIGVDPSGSGDTDNAQNDEIGVSVCGLGTDGIVYVLEDCSLKAGPATWAATVSSAYDRHEADLVVAEINFGGAMVEQVIKTANKRISVKTVHASRGKVARAEPFSSLYEQGKIRHVGYLKELEEELSGFSTSGYTGGGSPNRADAMIWALSELFPGVIAGRKSMRKNQNELYNQPVYGGWL